MCPGVHCLRPWLDDPCPETIFLDDGRFLDTGFCQLLIQSVGIQFSPRLRLADPGDSPGCQDTQDFPKIKAGIKMVAKLVDHHQVDQVGRVREVPGGDLFGGDHAKELLLGNPGVDLVQVVTFRREDVHDVLSAIA